MKRATILVGLMLAGCTTGGNMASVHEGMSRDEVIATLGQPDGARRDGRTEQLVYASRLMSGWSWDKATYAVTLVDGSVTGYGPTAVMTAPAPQPAIGVVTVLPSR